jgi:RHS repeat-associated protein
MSKKTLTFFRCFTGVLTIFSLLLTPTSFIFAQETIAPIVSPGENIETNTTTTIVSPDTNLDSQENTLEEIISSPDSIKDEVLEIGPTLDPVDTIKNIGSEEELKDKEYPVEEMARSSIAANSATASLATNSDSKVLRPNVDQSTGALIYNYPIEVPNGFNGQNPNLRLTYNSQDTKNDSAFGYGWSSSIPYIERINKRGVNDFYRGTGTDFTSSMFGELVKQNSTTYFPKSASDIVSLDFSSNVWTYIDKDGTTYVFGASASERQNDPSNSANIYKWMLTSVTDSNGNVITYTYTKDQGQIYPDTISYGGIYQIVFTKVTRGETVDSYKEGFHVITAKRVSQIDLNVSSALKKKYVLSYGTGDNGSRSILTSVQVSAYDSSSNLTTLPATTFSYSTRTTPNWNTSGSLTFPSGTDLLNGTSMAVDFNGDGYTDILTSFSDPNSNVTQVAYSNDGDGTWTTSSGYTPPVIFYYQAGAGLGKGYTTADLNGDQLPDLFRSVMECNGTICANASTIYMNTGTGWSLSTDTIPMSLQYLGSPTADMADFNGDGLPDIYAVARNFNGNNYPLKVYLNNGNGTWLDDTSNWTFPISSGSRAIYADINGDGIADIVNDGWYYTGGSCNCNTYVGTNTAYIGDGKGTFTSSTPYISPASYSFYPAGQPSPGYDWGNRVYDLNSDGLSDLVYSRNDSSGPTVRSYTYFNTSNTWSSNISAWVLPASIFKFSSNGNFTTGNPLDMDADGIPESYEATTIYKNTTAKPVDILTTITVPTGGTVTMTYQAAGQYKDGSGNLLNPALPFAVQTVKSITTTDPVTSVAGVSNYVYSGGSYYYNTPLDRKFSGFEKVSESRPDGSVVINYYHQGNVSSSGNYEYSDSVGKVGFIYRTDITNSVGTIQARSTTKYDTASPTTGAYFVYPIQTIDEINGKNTATTYLYNTTTGNLSSFVEYGKVTVIDPLTYTDTGSDQKTTNYTYATNGGTTIYKVSNKEVLDQASVKVNETKYYYDTQSLGTLTVGNNTKISQLKTGSTFIDILVKTYNGYGHVTSITDARNKTTTYRYDTNNLYVELVTDPLSLVTSYVHEYNTGKQTEVADQNGFVYQTIYDGFGRPVEEKIPDLTTPSTLITKKTYSYTDTSNAVSVQTSIYLDGSNIVTNYQYFDGLGRILQERNETESSFVSKDFAYTTSGQLLKESLPYVSSGSSKTSPTSTTTLYTNYTYDLLNRILTKINSIGTTSYTYSGFQTSVTDPLTKVKDYYTDAYGNLSQVDEHNSGSTYTTAYTWDLNGKLTGITDALGNVRAFTYDNMGRRLTAEDLHAPSDTTYGSWSYAYDDVGNIKHTVSPEAKTVKYTYDDINRVLTEDYTGASGIEITYVYDICTNGVGKLCAITMTSGADTTYDYNSNGGISSETKTINANTYKTSYTYDRQGNKLVIVYPDSAQVQYTYNNGGLLEKVEQKESGGSFANVVSNLDYSPTGTPTVIAYNNSVTTTNTYDANALYRLTNKVSVNGVSSHLQDTAYTYDANGNITQIVDASNTDTLKIATYDYDDLNRMVNADITSVAVGQSNYTYTYTYNEIGNITSGPTGTYVYNGSSGTNYANPHAATSINGVTNTYDKDGNLLTDGTLTNRWNYKDQLITSTDGTFTRTYSYDQSGSRVSSDDGIIVTEYPNKYYTYDGTTKTKNIYAGDILVSTITTASSIVTPYYVHTDHLGSTNVTTDSFGNQIQLLDYFPYGNTRISTGSPSNQRQYIGQMYDEDTGLNYLNARYMNSVNGRFVSQDPIFLVLGDAGLTQSMTGMTLEQVLMDPQLLNSYSYARNNPIRYTDPTGRFIDVPWISNSQRVQQGATTLYNQSPVWQTAMDHPVTVGAVVGVGVGVAAYGIAAGATAASLEYASGWGTQSMGNLTQLGSLPMRQHAIEGFSKLEATTGQTSSQILQQASNAGKSFVDYANKGNINIFTEQAAGKLNRITTNPEITRIISAGTQQVGKVANQLQSGRLAPLSQSQGLSGLVRGIINSLTK